MSGERVWREAQTLNRVRKAGCVGQWVVGEVGSRRGILPDGWNLAESVSRGRGKWGNGEFLWRSCGFSGPVPNGANFRLFWDNFRDSERNVLLKEGLHTTGINASCLGSFRITIHVGWEDRTIAP